MLCASYEAQACSDLPNICAQMEQHHRDMQDISATPPRQDEDDDGAYDRAEDQAPAPRRPDPTQARLNQAVAMARMALGNSMELERLRQDPRYQAYQHGAWDFFQDKEGAAPGDYCAALFWRKDGIVRISGPGGDYQGALITFWSQDIPRPAKVEKIKVTLSQTNEAPQTVQAFNYRLPNEEYGAIALAVPSIEAALQGMEDVHRFELALGGKAVANVQWHNGLAARDELRRCVSRRKK